MKWFLYLKNIYKDYQLNRYCKRWLKSFDKYVASLYNQGHSQEEIFLCMKWIIITKNNEDLPEIKMLLRNLPGMIAAHDPKNPVPFHRVD